MVGGPYRTDSLVLLYSVKKLVAPLQLTLYGFQPDEVPILLTPKSPKGDLIQLEAKSPLGDLGVNTFFKKTVKTEFLDS
jgi:hypothetical protein